MNDLLSKLSSYNLFNYLLPGVIFSILVGDEIRLPIIQRDIVSAAFLCYFIGLVISRFGSLVLEPILKRTSFIRFADYPEFVAATKKDELVNVLSEANNMYRTFCSLFILVLLFRGYVRLEVKLPFLKSWDAVILTCLLLIMFLFSYRKQTSYVSKRVKAAHG